MTATIAELDTLLDGLQARLPQMLEDHPSDGDFWMAFADAAEVIEYKTDEHTSGHVVQRINAMLAEHGRYIVTGELDFAPE